MYWIYPGNEICPVTFNLRGEGYIGLLLVEIFKERGTWFRDRKKSSYLSHMFKRITRRFLDNTFDPKPSVQTVPKKIIYFCLPFTGIHSLQIRTQINRRFPHLDARFARFFAPPDESLLFSLLIKDKVPKYLRSSVVYLFKVCFPVIRFLHVRARA